MDVAKAKRLLDKSDFKHHDIHSLAVFFKKRGVKLKRTRDLSALLKHYNKDNKNWVNFFYYPDDLVKNNNYIKILNNLNIKFIDGKIKLISTPNLIKGFRIMHCGREYSFNFCDYINDFIEGRFKKWSL